jgi:polar amino acid transport system substrate-binding protein
MTKLGLSTTLTACALALGVSSVSAAELPALPPEIAAKGELNVGVRCDQPPFGFKDQNGGFAGVEVEIARQIAEYAFGSKDKANLTCVTAESRIPQLMGKKVDLLVATLGITPERERVVAFSTPYRWDSSDVLVKADSPAKTLADLDGKTVIALKGSTQARWLGEHASGVQLTNLNSSSEALMAFQQGRAEGYAHDSATLVMISSRDKNLRRIGQLYGISEAAIGLRKDEAAWLTYVNASLARIKEQNLYSGWIKAVAPEGTEQFYVDGFTKPTPTTN